MAKPSIGIQLIVYGKRWQEDLPGVLREVARAGYDGIEANAALNDFYPTEQIRQFLAETGLTYMGGHSPYPNIADPAKLNAALDFVTAVGGSYLACSGVSNRQSLKGYEDSAAVFNAAGRTCRERGVTFCYHNHAWEFESFDGVKGIHRLAELTDPQVVKLCVDVYWVHIGGEDPAQFVARYADRVGYYHLKDGDKGVFSELGNGKVDLKSAIGAALRTNPEWLVYEQDRTDKQPEQSIVESRQYLRNTFSL